MIVSLPPSVQARLDTIEMEEGIPVLEQVQQGVSVWSHLRGEAERRIVGFAIMRVVTYRDTTGSD